MTPYSVGYRLVYFLDTAPLIHLELDFEDDWSDNEDGPFSGHDPSPPSDLPSALKRIQVLEQKLSQAQDDFFDYKRLVTQNLDISSISAEVINDPVPSSEAVRDDDTHYFQSYGLNGTSYFVDTMNDLTLSTQISTL